MMMSLSHRSRVADHSTQPNVSRHNLKWLRPSYLNLFLHMHYYAAPKISVIPSGKSFDTSRMIPADFHVLNSRHIFLIQSGKVIFPQWSGGQTKLRFTLYRYTSTQRAEPGLAKPAAPSRRQRPQCACRRTRRRIAPSWAYHSWSLSSSASKSAPAPTWTWLGKVVLPS
jgi:hypothetical protein